MKSFGQKSWMLPQPVLIIGTYDKNGKPNAMNAAWGGQWDAKEISKLARPLERYSQTARL